MSDLLAGLIGGAVALATRYALEWYRQRRKKRAAVADPKSYVPSKARIAAIDAEFAAERRKQQLRGPDTPLSLLREVFECVQGEEFWLLGDDLTRRVEEMLSEAREAG